MAAGGAASGTLQYINTLRYTGGDGTIVFNRNNTNINGVMNAGTGTLTLNGVDSSNGRISTSDIGALVFNAASGNISVGVARLVGSRVVKTGAHELLISTANPSNFTGGLYVNEGTVTAVQSGLGSNWTQLGAGSAGGLYVASGAAVNMDAFNANSTITYAFGALTGDGTVNVHTGGGTAITRFSGSLAAFSGVLNLSYKSTSGKVVLDLLEAAGVGSAARINVASNGTLQLEGGITVAAFLTLGGGNTSESLGQLRLEGDPVYSGNVTLTGGLDSNDYTIGSDSGVGGTISGNIGESGGSRILLLAAGTAAARFRRCRRTAA